MMGSLTLGNCVALFNITYIASLPATALEPEIRALLVSSIFPSAVEAALISILLIPAALLRGY